MATQTISITKQALPQTTIIPLQVVSTTPATKNWQHTTTFQCVCPAQDTPVCRHHQDITSTPTLGGEETKNTGFYLRRKGQPQRHIDWENLMEENTWTRCAQWAESSILHQYTSPKQHQNRTHIITGLCDFCLMGHRGAYSSDISRVEDQLADDEDSHTRGSSRSRSNNGEECQEEAFEMIDHDMEASILRLQTTIPIPSPSSFTLGLGLKTLPSFTTAIYGMVKGHTNTKNKNKNKNFPRRPSSSYSNSTWSSESGMVMDMEGEPDLDIINNFEEEIGLLELNDRTEGNYSPLDLEPEVWINHP